jgi:hypothetical protein
MTAGGMGKWCCGGGGSLPGHREDLPPHHLGYRDFWMLKAKLENVAVHDSKPKVPNLEESATAIQVQLNMGQAPRPGKNPKFR